MKVILDTNVFISGVFFSGPPYRILAAWRDDKIQLVGSPEILEEYRRVGGILAEDHSRHIPNLHTPAPTDIPVTSETYTAPSPVFRLPPSASHT